MAEEQKQPTAEAQQEIPEPQQAMQSQVTSQTPATKPSKNPKRVAAGKMVAEKTRLAREAHKKAYDEKMAKEREKKESAPAPEPAPETEPKPAAADSNGFTTNQWISIIGIGATLATTYIKRDDIKAFFTKKQTPPPEPAPQVTHESPPQPRPRKGIRNMD